MDMNIRLVAREKSKEYNCDISTRNLRFYSLCTLVRYFNSHFISFSVGGDQLIKEQRSNANLVFEVEWRGPCSSLGRYNVSEK
jgi:hypothetical protein